jgi:hypothetical protein
LPVRLDLELTDDGMSAGLLSLQAPSGSVASANNAIAFSNTVKHGKT